LENPFKVRPIILRGEGGNLSVDYLGMWWVKGKGRLSLPQEDKVIIWFANKVEDDALDIDEEDFSETNDLVLKRGKTYEVPYTQDGWGPQKLVAEQ
jgi:hypothetical protein